MLQQFLNHLNSIGPLQRDSFLLAVSGGVDSMVMLDLFLKSGLDFQVAHCNFQLRPEEAKREEQLVERTCEEKGVPIHIRYFSTKEYATENHLSTQVAARELRYQYFQQLLTAHGFNWVATAHHLNDSFETILLNLVRGTGLDGLCGIPAVQREVIRPLLCFTRHEIERYAEDHSIRFLHDSSNFTNDYPRNLVRNEVIPVLRKLNPALEETFRLTAERMKGSALLLDDMIKNIQNVSGDSESERVALNKHVIHTSPAPAVILWEAVKTFGFSYEQCRKVVLSEQSGKWFRSPTHRLLVDRFDFIVEKITIDEEKTISFGKDDSEVQLGDELLELRWVSRDNIIIGTDEGYAFIDADKISFPLIWRKWRDGDHFVPLGMSNQKKLSDFLIDRKIDRLAKEHITVLESSNEIIWVVGHRVSDKVKITPSTKSVVVFEWKGRRHGTR